MKSRWTLTWEPRKGKVWTYRPSDLPLLLSWTPDNWQPVALKGFQS